MGSKLQNEIAHLYAAEKVELIDTSWESLEAEAPTLTSQQRGELDRRIAHYRRSPSDVISWEQAKADLFKTP